MRIEIPALVASWDPQKKGSVLKSEFHMRIKTLMERGGLVYPGKRAADDLFDKYDADRSGVIDAKELTASLLAAVEAGRLALEEHGAVMMQQMARAAELRTRSRLAEDAATSVDAALALEEELGSLVESIQSDLRTQVSVQRQYRVCVMCVYVQ